MLSKVAVVSPELSEWSTTRQRKQHTTQDDKQLTETQSRHSDGRRGVGSQSISKLGIGYVLQDVTPLNPRRTKRDLPPFGGKEASVGIILLVFGTVELLLHMCIVIDIYA